MVEFRIDTNDLGDGRVELTVHGFLDAHTFEQLEEGMAQAFSDSQYKVVVNLAGVNYISSAGAGVFIGALTESKENGGNIILVDPTDSVMQVFELLGLSEIFQIVPNREQAIMAFG